MLLPLPGALEMHLTDGSSWPTYTPLSSNRPPQLPRGSVQPPPRSTLTSWYLGLWPLQSIMPVLWGLTPALAFAALALAAAGRAAAALAARPPQVAVPITTINDPASAHSRAHRLPIVVLPRRFARTHNRHAGAGRGALVMTPAPTAQSSSRRLC